MKVKNVAVTAAVCAALMGSQATFAEEQPEGMDFAFDNAEGSSVQMSELSGSEMDETEGAWVYPALNGGVGLLTSTGAYLVTSPNPTWQGLGNSAVSGAVSGAASSNPVSAAQFGTAAGIGNAAADTGSTPINPY